MSDDLEADLALQLAAPSPSLPEYWIARMSIMNETDLRTHWAIMLSEESIPPTTLDSVFQWLRERLGVRMGAIRSEFQQRLREINADEPETHGDWARWYLEGLPPNFAADGMFWIFDDESTIFRPCALEFIANILSAQNGKNCTRDGDYRAIAGRAYMIRAQETKEQQLEPMVGVAAGSIFYRMTPDGIVEESLAMEHRARFKIEADPDESEGLFTKFIAEIADEDQVKLLRQHFAGVLFGVQWMMQKVVLWYGAGATGKSTLQSILQVMVPDELISSVSPKDWDKEYHRAAMAGMVLNVVGEVDERSPLGAEFKNITGGGKVNARHPTHQPFSYVSKAAQVFCSNYLPPSTDKSDAFWRRWSVVEFNNVKEEKARDPALAAKIRSKELGCVLAFALKGAQEIVDASTEGNWRFRTTARQADIETQWTLEINSVAAFLADEDALVISEECEVGKTQLFKEYLEWSRDNNMRPLGRNKFNREMSENEGWKKGIRIGRNEVSGVRVWIGVGLLAEKSF